MKVPCVIAPRRPGDLPICCAGPAKRREVLGREAAQDQNDMCRDSWHWQSQTPNGYDG